MNGTPPAIKAAIPCGAKEIGFLRGGIYDFF